MLLKTHKMYLALAIFTAVSLPQSLHAAAYEESYTGTRPLAIRLPGLGLTSDIALKVFKDYHNDLDYQLADLLTITPISDGTPATTAIYHLPSGSFPQIIGNQYLTDGEWTFAKVGSSGVVFGEWNEEPDGRHTVFYGGPEVDGKAFVYTPYQNGVTYTIKTISHYDHGAAPTSTLTANFIAQTASSTGDISFTNGQIQSYSLGANYGALTASNVSVASSGGTGGTLSGQFFNYDAAQVAGIVKFSDRNKDAAFGGSRN